MINVYSGPIKLIKWLNLFKSRSYCSSVSAKKWSKTVFIPASDLPSRKAPKSEVDLLEKPCFYNLYRDQNGRPSDKLFVLHDGPPYANGSLHFGHVINKTLKDIICRYKIRQGYKVNFIPGWDCHGLPIELKVYKEKGQSIPTDPLEIRQKARKFAQSAIDEQIKVFRRMGIAADWDNPYTTFSNEFVLNQLQAFKTLYQKGLIHRSFLPIYFSPSNKTTLAESELEYNTNHTSPSIFFQFKVNHNLTLRTNHDIYALIWTTTPWTLPANQAIAFSPKIEYIIVFASELSRYFIIAKENLLDLQSKLGTPLSVERTICNEELSKLSYSHPMRLDSKQYLPFLSAEYVTSSKGTGLVHCAPNHGREDFDIAKKNGLSINNCIVDDNGNFVSGLHSELDGKSVLEGGSSLVMNLLKDEIVHKEDFVHSYPYDWRSGKPVIIKTSQQWFIDVGKVRDKCLSQLKTVNFFPSGIQNKICDEISTRPPWCISRQRVWGVPIPVFYRKEDVNKSIPIVSSESIDYLINKVKENGIEIWWSSPESELIPDQVCKSFGVNKEEIVAGRDIFDVWFDSGMTWNSVLAGDKIADIYLEGVDQCHGWFQTSLILSIALRDLAPYKSVYVHGFAVDGDGRKMSKSVGNVIDPLPLIESKYGSDVMRLFVARYGSHHGNVKVDDEKLKTTMTLMLKFRNIFKFCLGSLRGFDSPGKLDYSKLNLINKYMLHQLWSFNQSCQKNYNDNDFRNIITESVSFIDDFSSFYLKIVKDSLYCDPLDSIGRSSCQSVIYYFLETFNNFLSPIIPFLFEEINIIRKKDNKAASCLLDGWFECPSIWKNDQVSLIMGIIRLIKESIDNETEDNKHFGKPFTATIICHRKSDYETLKTSESSSDNLEQQLSEILQLSQVKLSQSIDLESVEADIKISCEESIPFTILLNKTNKSSCPRCRRYLSRLPNDLCHRCDAVISKHN
ncbi:isoleucine--tRNA ligase, mitochondrial [Tetranychus urticae]|uniref:isoleucine--tRNA ligase n=1 Tax=Tetranychus urticae TaxID=32264 RepID=T1JVM9_TETUR|nr:isoleucine--tRNA ligase, mitochondrial [Tetranychus urticae]